MADTALTSSARKLCTVCQNCDAIYTCPRCHTRTCSLPCSTHHKSATNCSGVRNKAAFVNLRNYGWGTMMDDYVYLEEMGRKVGEWGLEIGKGGYQNANRNANGSGRGRGSSLRGRGRDRGRIAHGAPRTKREILRTQLELRDISMDLLPVGMERRKHNQSSWDFRTQTALLTIELVFHPPKKYASSQPGVQSFKLLTHRNNLMYSLLSIIQDQVREIASKREKTREKDKGKEKEEKTEAQTGLLPPWLLALVLPQSNSSSPSSPSQVPSKAIALEPTALPPYNVLMRAPLSPLEISATCPKSAYYRIETTQPLLSALYGMQFVEYPTIEVWPCGEFNGVIVDPKSPDEVVKAEVRTQPFRQGAQEEPPNNKTYDEYIEELERRPKRRKIDMKAGQKAISGLLGGYGSDEGAEDEAGLEKSSLALLDGYEESDHEEQNVKSDESAEDEGDTDDELEVDPKVLMELMRQAQAQGQDGWNEDGQEDEDRVDWGEGDSVEEAE